LVHKTINLHGGVVQVTSMSFGAAGRMGCGEIGGDGGGSTLGTGLNRRRSLCCSVDVVPGCPRGAVIEWGTRATEGAFPVPAGSWRFALLARKRHPLTAPTMANTTSPRLGLEARTNVILGDLGGEHRQSIIEGSLFIMGTQAFGGIGK
jgi:hypothetical protein